MMVKAYDTYGCQCNGCGQFAEWCHCFIDNDGTLIEARDESGRPIEPAIEAAQRKSQLLKEAKRLVTSTDSDIRLLAEGVIYLLEE